MARLPAAERREQLLDAAATVFATYGYWGTTTAVIAKAAGVTEPIIYRHFSSKSDLFIALIQRTGDDTVRLWEHELRDIRDPADRLSRLIHANPMVSAKGRARYRVIIQAITETQGRLSRKDDPDAAASVERMQDALKDHIRKLHAFIAREVRTAQDSGQVSPRFSPEITAWALIDMGMGYGLLSAMGISGHGVDPAGRHVTDVIGRLMLADRYKEPTRPASDTSQPPGPNSDDR